jgi:hypothetical protein
MSAPDPVLATLVHTSKDVLATMDGSPRRPIDRERVLVTLGRARFARTRRRVRAGAGALLLLGLLAGGWWRWHGERPLAYAVEGGVLAGGRLHAEHSSRLRFSDGSAVDFESGSKVRLASLHARGAQLVLEEGTARVDIVHQAGAHWQIEAGPYLVTVIGTAFRVTWSARDYSLDLEMDRGAVTVRGPLAENGLMLEAGHHLSARPRQGEVSVTSSAIARIEPAPSHPGPIISPLPVARPAARAVTVDLGKVWARRIAAGDFESVLRAARRRGLASTMEEGSLAQLGALADAARYARRPEIAEHALLALRRRFPASVEARDSAFVLGRLEEDRAQDDLARRWYDRYLDEVPAGSYVAAAWGRKLTLARRSADGEAAAAMARDYLQRFPEGPYAALATAMVSSDGR